MIDSTEYDLLRSLIAEKSSRCSKTVKFLIKGEFWGQIPILLIGFPPIVTDPFEGVINPLIILIVVDLPAPFGPRRIFIFPF